MTSLGLTAGALGAEPLVRNGSFEQGFEGWTRWGRNADRIKLETGLASTGTNSARIQAGHNALYFRAPLSPGQAYELQFSYRLAGGSPAGQVAIGFFRPGGGLHSAGGQDFKLRPDPPSETNDWFQFREVFLPTAIATSGQFSFSAGEGATLWIDAVALHPVPRPAGLAEPSLPWEGLKRRTARPLFKELLTREPGGYTVVSWAHDLNPKPKAGDPMPELTDDAARRKAILEIYERAGEAGMGYMDLPGRLNGGESWDTPEFHREQHRKYGVHYDVFSEGSASITAGLRNGAELLNPTARAAGAAPTLSWVDPAYVEAQCAILRHLGAQLRGEPFVGWYYGKDEPMIHLPEGTPETWGSYGRDMAREVLERYGFGRFAVPLPSARSFLDDPRAPLRWVAYQRWANDRFIASRTRLRQVLHEADPGARYSPANYWFMSGFPPFDYSRLAAISDLVEGDPYASSAERERGRGVFNHSFGAKFLADLTGKPVRIVAQAFHYAGYQMTPEDLREWVSQALRGGASAITYYEMDSPRWTDPARWQMMLHLSRVITRLNRLARPTTADTAVLYTLYTHMSQGASTSGDQVYAAHALLGELAGAWFQFVSDTQLERHERSLDGFKAVYLPLAKYVTPATTGIIEAYVRAGGVLICGDAEAFTSDLAGNDTSAIGARLLGIKTRGPRTNAVPQGGGMRHRVEALDRITLASALWGLPAGTSLPLFTLNSSRDDAAEGATSIGLIDGNSEVLGTYPDGSPAIVRHRLGQGFVITFAANPFAPRVTVDPSAWPALFKGLQVSLGCKVDQPIWRFLIPPPEGLDAQRPSTQ